MISWLAAVSSSYTFSTPFCSLYWFYASCPTLSPTSSSQYR